MKILEKLYPLSNNNMVVKKTTTHTCFSHLLCFLFYNYLKYFLGTPTVGKNPQLNVKCTLGVLTIHVLGADCNSRMLWWPSTPAVSEMHVFCADISFLFQISTWDSDILLSVFGTYLEDSPVYHFVKIFTLSFDVINLNFVI